jgi:serine/threonine-protein kinase
MIGRSLDESLTRTELGRLIEAVDRFEAAWKAGKAPRIEDYLDGFEGSEFDRLRRELSSLASELAHRTPSTASGPTVDESDPVPASTEVDRPKVNLDFEPIGDFEPIELLGRGGMGVVYRARQRGVGRVVALKVIRPEFGPEALGDQFEEIVSRFRTEIRAAGSVQHDNIVEVFAAGEDRVGTTTRCGWSRGATWRRRPGTSPWTAGGPRGSSSRRRERSTTPTSGACSTATSSPGTS